MNLLGQCTVLHNKVVCLAIVRNNPCPTTLSVTLHLANSKPFETAINIISEGKGRQQTARELI